MRSRSNGTRYRVIAGQKLDWIYGTACAEPRLSTTVARRNPLVH